MKITAKKYLSSDTLSKIAPKTRFSRTHTLDPVELIRFDWVFLFALLWAITMTLRLGDFTLNLFLFI